MAFVPGLAWSMVWAVSFGTGLNPEPIPTAYGFVSDRLRFGLGTLFGTRSLELRVLCVTAALLAVFAVALWTARATSERAEDGSGRFRGVRAGGGDLSYSFAHFPHMVVRYRGEPLPETFDRSIYDYAVLRLGPHCPTLDELRKLGPVSVRGSYVVLRRPPSRRSSARRSARSGLASSALRSASRRAQSAATGWQGQASSKGAIVLSDSGNGGDATMLRAYGLEIPQNLGEVCDPSRTALIVYDMQVGVLRQLKHAAAVIAKVAQVLGAARDAGMRVFFMRHVSLPKELMGVFQLRMAMAWQRAGTVEEVRSAFLRDSPRSHISPQVAPLPSEAVFDKITMSAFEGTPLDIALRDCGVSAFIIVGVATEIGIEPTVRHGADLGYIPVLVTDACGAGNEEAGQRALASLRFMGDALFTTAEEIGKILRERTGAATTR